MRLVTKQAAPSAVVTGEEGSSRGAVKGLEILEVARCRIGAEKVD
jgi:hypothetical protein